jgi:hypothetical protein
MPCIKENTAVDDNTDRIKRRDQADLIALVKEIVRYWRELGRKRFEVNPSPDGRSFEDHWPMLLENFFLAETIRAARRFRALSENREN